MRTLGLMLLVVVVVMGSCKKDDPGPIYISVAGDWTYTTPDGKITINFTINEVGTGAVSYQNVSTIVVDGQTGKSAVSIGNITDFAMIDLHVNANDPALTYAYPFDFVTGIISADFKQINVASATYTWPHDKTNSLKDIAIVRK